MTNNTQDNTNDQHDSIGFDQVQELETGDAIAVCAFFDQVATILAGRIEWTQSTDPEDLFEKPIDTAETDNPITYNRYVHIDAEILWKITSNGITDESARLHDRPPYQPNPREPPKDAIPCSLALGSNQRVALLTPTPQTNGSRVVDYHPGAFRPVVNCISGPIVEPTELLPDRYDPPETSSE